MPVNTTGIFVRTKVYTAMAYPHLLGYNRWPGWTGYRTSNSCMTLTTINVLPKINITILKTTVK